MTDFYKIVFEGSLKNKQESTIVKTRLAKLFRADTARIEQFLREAPVVIKRGLPKEDALKYQRAILATGAACHLEKEETTPVQAPPKTTPALRVCPKCGFQQNAGQHECMRCGIVFSRFQQERQPSVSEDDDDADTRDMAAVPERKRTHRIEETDVNREPLSIEREGWLSLLAGAVMTGVVMFVPFLTYIFGYLKTLVHEFGHAVFGWLFAYPTIPAFDFMYGGGVAIHSERQMLLLFFVYLGFGWLLFTFRKNIPTLMIIGIMTGVFSLCAFTELHSLIILFIRKRGNEQAR